MLKMMSRCAPARSRSRAPVPGRPVRYGRPGAALLYVTAVLFVFVALASLGVEVGRIHLAKGELQLAADAAARAACAQLARGVAPAQIAAVAAAGANSCDGTAVVLDPLTDLVFGTWDQPARTFTALTGAAAAEANAVRVSLLRTTPLMLARVVGANSSRVRANSTACLISNTGAYAIIGINSVQMYNDSFTDSYRSSAGPWSMATHGLEGAVASNGNISLYDSADVYGDARCGVGKSTTVLSTARIFGLKAPLALTLRFPSVTAPSGLTDLGDVNMSSGSSSLAGGRYLIGSLRMTGSARHTWTGPVELYFRDNYYVDGDAVINTYQNKPENRKMFFLPTCTTGRWGGSHSCVADMYGPDTDFTVTGSADLFGRIVAKSIVIQGTGGMHYDKDLPPVGQNATTQAISQVQ
jgi:Flp pilus assembly protein TadG